MNKRAGFTLIELMIVVIILASLAGMILPRILDRADDAKQHIARGEIASIVTALKFYKLDMGGFPTNEQGLEALMTEPSAGDRSGQGAGQWKGPYLEKTPDDPWGRPYQYRRDSGPVGFEVWSDGADPSQSGGKVSNLQAR